MNKNINKIVEIILERSPIPLMKHIAASSSIYLRIPAPEEKYYPYINICRISNHYSDYEGFQIVIYDIEKDLTPSVINAIDNLIKTLNLQYNSNL